MQFSMPPVFADLASWDIPNWVVPIQLVLLGLAAALATLYLMYVALKLGAPKVAAIALAAAKDGWSQPVFWVELIFGALLLVIFVFLPYNTFGEDIKVVKDNGLTLITVLAIILSTWTASISISNELEGRTALTVLSKPIGRRQFVMGKLLGVLAPVAILYIVLGAIFLSTVLFKVHYESKENSENPPTVAECREEMLQIAPGLLIGFLQAIVMTSISVAISTRLGMLPNLLVCAVIYILGHLAPLVVQSELNQNAIVRFVGQLITAVLPALEHYDMSAPISAGKQIPWSVIGLTAIYSIMYSFTAMIVAMLLFEDRDLA